MTRYTVVWAEGARDELAELWLASRVRKDIADAANLVDRELAEDAPAKGIDVAEGLRAPFAPPLRVLFAVREEDRVVQVARVRPL